jgi:hypothetical protein
MKWLFSLLILLNTVGCISVSYNNDGSTPLNYEESRIYSSEIIRCYKIGGTRIVKIDNFLRCF